MVLEVAAERPARVDTLFVDDARLTSVAPSPDGTRLAMVSTASGSPDIVVYNRATGTVRAVFRSSAREMEPDWDGTGALVFTSEVGRHYIVHRVELGAGVDTEPILPGDRARRVRVSPDGSWLAWTEDGLVHASPRGAADSRMARVYPVSSAPSWSPDGRYLAFSSRQSGSDDIYIADVTSGRAVRVTTDGRRDEQSPHWHPGGDRLVFVTDRSAVQVIDGLEPWLERLSSDIEPRVYPKSAGR
jgi:TolB protein